LRQPYSASGRRCGLWRLRWVRTACSILRTARSSPIRGCHVGGQPSVRRTMPRPQGSWRGCSRAAVFALPPEPRTRVGHDLAGLSWTKRRPTKRMHVTKYGSRRGGRFAA
jgi:hypothetical protein